MSGEGQESAPTRRTGPRDPRSWKVRQKSCGDRVDCRFFACLPVAGRVSVSLSLSGTLGGSDPCVGRPTKHPLPITTPGLLGV